MLKSHTFPKDPILRQEWRKFCNRSNKWNPTRTSVICSDHFTPSSFQELSNIRRMLIVGAKPTLRTCYCSSIKQDQLHEKYPNKVRKTSRDLEPSLSNKIKDDLLNKNKKIKRLQDNNRYLKNKMESLKGVINKLRYKSVPVKEENDLLEESSVSSEKSLKRSRKMSIKQDEIVLSNGIGLAECRTCFQALDANSVLVDLFQCWVPPWDGMESTIAEDLAKLANIQITQTDRYSKVICEPCCLKLQSACDFACSVRKNDRLLHERYPPLPEENDFCNKTVWPKPIQLDKSINGTVYESVMDVEIKQEVVSEDEYTNNIGMDDSREAELPTLEIKIEPEELMQPMHVQTEGNTPETKIEELQSTCAVLNGHDFHDEKEDIVGLTNGNDRKEEISIIKEEPVSEEEDGEAILNDLSLECMLCCKEFNSVSGLKAHVIAQHSYKSVKRKTGDKSPERSQKNHEFVCETCQRRFATSTDLMVHETCHNKSVCYACSAKFDTFEQLTRHSRRCKAIANKELRKPKTLEDVKRPINQNQKPTHTYSRKPLKEKLRCPICNDEFSDKYYLTIHEEIYHLNSEETNDKEEVLSDIKMETDNLRSIFGTDD